VERIFPMIFFGTYDCNRNLEHLLEELKRKLLTDSLKCVKHPSPKIFNRILEKLIRHNR
jgi:restriction endonuclease Mrr